MRPEAELQWLRQEAQKKLAKFEKRLSFNEGNALGAGHYQCLVAALRKHPYLIVGIQHNLVKLDAGQLIGIAEVCKEALSATSANRAEFGIKNRCKFVHDVIYFPESMNDKVRG